MYIGTNGRVNMQVENMVGVKMAGGKLGMVKNASIIM